MSAFASSTAIIGVAISPAVPQILAYAGLVVAVEPMLALADARRPRPAVILDGAT